MVTGLHPAFSRACKGPELKLTRFSIDDFPVPWYPGLVASPQTNPFGLRFGGFTESLPLVRIFSLNTEVIHVYEIGVVSVTFRELSVREVVDVAKEAGLSCIEWGGDIHVPHGDVRTARETAALTCDSGLNVSSYGSYYRTGLSTGDNPDFRAVLETAEALSAPIVRVWAGNRGSDQADESWWSEVVEDSYRIATMAEEAGISVAYEYHGGTLTDTVESTEKLLRTVDHPSIGCYWQPLSSHSPEDRLRGISTVGDRLRHIHVFHWIGQERQPLSQGIPAWREYLKKLEEVRQSPSLLLEFVLGDSKDQLLQDARALRDLICE